MNALVGSLVFAGVVYETTALHLVDIASGDVVEDEALALEKEEWPWHWRKAGQPPSRKKTDETDDLDVHEGLPPTAGCYMRMLSGCPRKPMRTQAWRRDTWASQHYLDEARCYQRKHLWDTHCESEDAEMLYVGNGTSSKPVGQEGASQLVGSDASSEPVSSERDSEHVGHQAISQLGSSDVIPQLVKASQLDNSWSVSAENSDDPEGQDTSSEPVSNASSELVSAEKSYDPVGQDTSSEPMSSEASSEPVGLLQSNDAWPWSRKHSIKKHEEAPTAQARHTSAGAGAATLVGWPTQPGCYMRMSSGCPKRPMRTQMWRHDDWAEQRELDRAGCEARKGVWDKYCETDDAHVVFVPKQ